MCEFSNQIDLYVEEQLASIKHSDRILNPKNIK